jgi:hypothetical protein
MLGFFIKNEMLVNQRSSLAFLSCRGLLGNATILYYYWVLTSSSATAFGNCYRCDQFRHLLKFRRALHDVPRTSVADLKSLTVAQKYIDIFNKRAVMEDINVLFIYLM